MTDLDFDPNHISQTSDGRYFLLPFNEYQLGNLLGAIKRAEYNGDWWWEIVNIVGTTMQKYGLTLGSNWGDEFSINNLEALEPTNHARQLSHLRGGGLQQIQSEIEPHLAQLDSIIGERDHR